VLSGGASVSDQQMTLWVFILSFTLQILTQLDLCAFYVASFEIHSPAQKTTQKKEPGQFQSYLITLN